MMMSFVLTKTNPGHSVAISSTSRRTAAGFGPGTEIVSATLPDRRVLTRYHGSLSEKGSSSVMPEYHAKAKAWSSKDSDDVLALLRVHSSPLATMSVPRSPEQ